MKVRTLHTGFIAATLIALLVNACSFYDNQTTYFNTYYNMKRIMGEVEDEFAFQDENKRTKPRVLVPGLDTLQSQADGNVLKGNSTMSFLKAFVVEKSKLQPVATKVDSILIKGSKVLANHPKSNYVEGSLFLMGKSYFFRQEWVASQQKCIELIERYADGDYSPDAHLLLAKDYLLQRKITQGKQTLSKTIDVAWYKDRYDILSEAFRIQAEMALEEGLPEKAEQPYRQAIAQSDDDVQNARWQVDLASISYRLGRYDVAAEQFEDVFTYTPDPLAQFEALLYRASSLTMLGKFDEAENILNDIADNRNFDDWSSFVAAQRLELERARKGDLKDPALIAKEKEADTSFVGKPELMAQSFQKGMKLYQEKQYDDALKYFAKAKAIRTPIYELANKYFNLIRQWEDSHRRLGNYSVLKMQVRDKVDSVTEKQAQEYYTLARTHENMENRDSAIVYYWTAYDSSTVNDPSKATFLFALARIYMQSDPAKSDSLLEVITERYPNSEVAKESFKSLGYPEGTIVDDAAELYKSGTSFRKVGDYVYAQRQYMTIVQKYDSSDYAPQALYALGWMYEHDAHLNDSALYYYEELMRLYPRSQYAKEVRASVEFALAARNGVEVADSLLLIDQDEELLKRAKAGEKSLIDQVIQNNANSMNLQAPVLNNIPGMPSIPGVNGTGIPLPNSTPGKVDLSGKNPMRPGGALPNNPFGTPSSDSTSNPQDTTGIPKP